jgi:hypothetical protein
MDTTSCRTILDYILEHITPQTLHSVCLIVRLSAIALLMTLSTANVKVSPHYLKVDLILIDCGEYCASCNLKTGCEMCLTADISSEWVYYQTVNTPGLASFDEFL